MTNDQVNMILRLNREFYKKVADEFSQTRNGPWEGWGRVVEKISLPSGAKVLDLGCGNGRFYEFISNKHKNILYTGIDTSDELLKIARTKFKTANFLNLDFVADNLSSLGNFDLVTAFGIFHHIPTLELRIKLVKKFAALLKPNGYFIFSIWNFDEAKSLPTPESLRFLEQGDFMLGWGNNNDALRYCHKDADDEIKTIISTLRNCDVECVETLNDKKISDKNFNTYYLTRAAKTAKL